MVGTYFCKKLSFMKLILSQSFSYHHIVLRSLSFSSEAFRSLHRDSQLSAFRSCDDSSKLNLTVHGIKFPHLIPSNKDHLENLTIELVDPNIWPISFNSAHEVASNLDKDAHDEEILNGDSIVSNSLDFDEIEDLKLRKQLFYKLDRGSIEYEERNVSFYRKKSIKKCVAKVKGCKKSEKSIAKTSSRMPSSSKALVCEVPNKITCVDKRVRTPTFNQLTDPYHLPFCLDIFITKGSVRASVIHRVTSKVVAVAHSISKDLKFDLTYKKDATACAAVGQVLARRAIEDDIHNLIYTPRKGDKIEGKLQIVLQSISDNGVDVKVKLKQRKPIKQKSHFKGEIQKESYSGKRQLPFRDTKLLDRLVKR